MKAFRTNSSGTLRTTTVLGKGGEGIVFNVEGHPDIALKVYTDGKEQGRQDKVLTMVRSELYKKSPLVAFPLDTVFGERGEFVGFTMRKIGGVKPLHELYAPGSRKIEFPKADYTFLVRTALNVARSIASVHQAGCVVGDINPSGMLISAGATVTLIDADSFQVRSGAAVHRCIVGTGEYTPQELQGVKLETIDRNVSHDAFGLAVVIFQLLFLGRHPFAGRFNGQGDMPIERAIKEGRFAYSARKAETRMEPPPFVPTLSDLTTELASAFERAFSRNVSNSHLRPSAGEWVSVLGRFEAELIPCRVNASHHHPKHATTCPWCRLENGTGAVLFPSLGISGAPGRQTFDLAAVLALIERVGAPGRAPDPASIIRLSPPISRSLEAKEIRRARTVRSTFGLIIAIGSIAATVAGFPFALIGLLLAGVLWFGGGGANSQLATAKVKAEGDWRLAVAEWELEAGDVSFQNKRGALRRAVEEYNGLSALEKSRLDDLDRRRREIQLSRFLERHLLSRSKIQGVGDGRKAVLAAYGIENAADVSLHAISAVPGFGPLLTSNLMKWRETVVRKFVFNPTLGTDTADIQHVKNAISQRRSEIEQILRRGPLELEQIRNQAVSARAAPTQRLIEAYRALKQAEADLA